MKTHSGSGQRGLFDPAEGSRLRDEAIKRVAQGADAHWRRSAMIAVHEVALVEQEFTTDDVEVKLRDLTSVRPRDLRALGAIMLAAVTVGLIERTDRTKKSALAKNHRRPKQVWQSLVYAEHLANAWHAAVQA
jgi:hypothetical protein